MHELSIAQRIVEIAGEEASRHEGGRVQAVHLRLGPLSGVVADSLLFAWNFACEETPLQGASLEIEAVPVRVRCRSCRAESEAGSEYDLRCPSCGSTATEAVAGRELEITSLEVE